MKQSMKSFLVAVCCICIFAFAGCSKDFEKEIIGSWAVQSIIDTDYLFGQCHVETEIFNESHSMTFTFSEDKAVVMAETNSERTMEVHGTWVINDKTLKMTFVEDGREERSMSLDVDIDGDAMTLSKTRTEEGVSLTSVAKLKRI